MNWARNRIPNRIPNPSKSNTHTHTHTHTHRETIHFESSVYTDTHTHIHVKLFKPCLTWWSLKLSARVDIDLISFFLSISLIYYLPFSSLSHLLSHHVAYMLWPLHTYLSNIFPDRVVWTMLFWNHCFEVYNYPTLVYFIFYNHLFSFTSVRRDT